VDPIELYNLLGRQPFQPVRVVCKDGRTFNILARRFAVVGVDFLDIGYQAEGYPEGVCGSGVSLDLQDVLRVEPLVAPQATVSSRLTMDAMELYNHLGNKPFHPLRIVLKDGRSYIVHTREFAAVAETFLDMGYQALGAPGGIWGGHVRVLLDEISHVEPVAGAKAGLAS